MEHFVPLLLSIFLLSVGVVSASDAVVDAEGNELQRGQLYYAQSIFCCAGEGGLRLRSLNGSCPPYVTKSGFGDPNGQPLAFFPENLKDDTIRVGNTLYAMFVVPTRCSESTVWQLDRRTDFVTTGGTASTAIGPHYSRFAIVKSGESSLPYYQFQSCPCTMGGSGGPACLLPCSASLGLATEEGKTLLTPKSNVVHNVIFVKATEGAARESMLSSLVKRSIASMV